LPDRPRSLRLRLGTVIEDSFSARTPCGVIGAASVTADAAPSCSFTKGLTRLRYVVERVLKKA
jgi:hypothetical protein